MNHRIHRIVIPALLLICLSATGLSADVDAVLVEKGKRKMHLLSEGTVVKSYDISLGDRPEGHKQRQGDERTPEGRYIIDYRNPHSAYHLSLHISYPNRADRERARQRGVDPGGLIMIHGLPNGYQRAEPLFKGRDWTDGCIAVDNKAIEEIWALVKDGTPIEITP